MPDTSENSLTQNPAVRDLLAQGARDTHVSYAQINDLLIDLELDEDAVESLFELFESRAIAIVDEAAPKIKEPKTKVAPATIAVEKPKISAKTAAKADGHSDLDDILADLEKIQVSDDLDSVAQFLAESEEEIAPADDEDAALYGGEDLDDEQRPVADALKIYLTRMGEIPRLELDAERELARIGRDGTPDQAREAKNALVEANLRLVVHLSKAAATRTTLPVTDLLQEGNLGLLDAVERYRPESKKTFGAYATWWIRRAMNRAIADNARVMSVSSELYNAIQKVQNSQRALTQTLGRAPSRAEIAQASGLSVEQIEEAQRAAVKPLSLDSPVGAGSEDSTELGETLSDSDISSDAIADASDRKEAVEGMTALLSELTDREREIVLMRFGLGDYKSAGPQAADDVSRKLGLSRERLHDLETKALRKLRKKAKGAGLDQLLG